MESSEKSEARKKMPSYYFLAGLLLLAIAIAVALLFKSGLGGGSRKIEDAKLADAAALSEQIAQQCAVGRQTSEQANVSASLAEYVAGLSSGAKVTTSDVGAIVDKITPDDKGLAIYKEYTTCLKQQAIILLSQRGIVVQPSSEEDAEALKDETLRQSISGVSYYTPKSRLVQLLGEPIASLPDAEIGDGGSVDLYQYKNMLFLADYYKYNTRIAISISTKDPLDGTAMFIERIRNFTIKDAIERCGGIKISGRHQSAHSGICPASRATNNEKSVVFFHLIHMTGPIFDKSSSCQDLIQRDTISDRINCAGLNGVPAIGIVITDDSETSDTDLNLVATSWMRELDFGGNFVWYSDKERRAMDERDEPYNAASDEEIRRLDALARQERVRRMRTPVTPAVQSIRQ